MAAGAGLGWGDEDPLILRRAQHGALVLPSNSSGQAPARGEGQMGLLLITWWLASVSILVGAVFTLSSILSLKGEAG